MDFSFTNDRNMVQVSGDTICTSDGKTYYLQGGYLTGPNGFRSPCDSIESAKNMVIGMHGGKYPGSF